MSTELAPSSQQIERSRPGKVTGRLKAAVEAMVWLGLKRAAAAEHAGLTEHALYVAFRRPHVKAHYLAELDVLRTSERARNIHRLTEIRDAANNMPAVQAIKTLEEIGSNDIGRGAGAASVPGLTIVIQQPAASLTPHVRDIEAKALNSNGDGRIASAALPDQGDADR